MVRAVSGGLIRSLSCAVLAAVVMLTVATSAAAQTDPYTNGSVTPPPSGCPTNPTVTIDPRTARPNQELHITVGGIVPGHAVTVFLDNRQVGAGNADAAGQFRVTTTAPASGTSFRVCADAPPCQLACTDPVELVSDGTGGNNGGGGGGSGGGGSTAGGSTSGGSTAGGATGNGTNGGVSVLGATESNTAGFARNDTSGTSGRGFARTGIDLLPWLIAALLCLLIGRALLEHSRRIRRRNSRRTRLKTRHTTEAPSHAPEDALVP